MTDSPLTIVIPNYNGLPYLPRLLQSLADQRDITPSIIIIDDCSTDDSRDYLATHHPRIRLIPNPRNLGFAASANIGLRAALEVSPIVALLNNDTHLDPHWAAEGLRPFADPLVGSVASLILLADPPHLIDSAGDVYSVVGGALKRNHLRPRETANTLPEETFSACAAAAFYRREALAHAGLLDERFESYYEDVDLGFRLALAGYRCRFNPRSICYHHLSSSYSPSGWKYHFNSARNAEWVWQSNMPPDLRRRYRLSRRVFVALQLLADLFRGHLRPTLAGLRAAHRNPALIESRRAQSAALAAASNSNLEPRLIKSWLPLHITRRNRFIFDIRIA